MAHFCRKFKEEVDDGRPVWFVNLTVDPKTLIEGEEIEPLESRKYVSHAWGKLRDRLARRTDELNYAASFERQKGTGLWHMHVLVSAGFEAVENRNLEGIRTMIREQAFGAGFGAVCKTKRVAAGAEGGEMGEDGRPETLAGAVGYVVKYCLKDALDAAQSNKKRKAIISSQGFGYNSKRAKEERKAYMESKKNRRRGEDPGQQGETESKQTERSESGPAENGDQAGAGEEVVEVWEPLVEGGGGDSEGFVDTITEEDRRRFEAIDRSNATMRYEEKQENGRWRVYHYEKDTENVSWVEYDRYPEADGATVTARSSGAG